MKKVNLALDIWSSPLELRQKLSLAWEAFVTNCHAVPEVRSLVLQSWERCHREGIDPVNSYAPIILAPDDAKEQLTATSWYLGLSPLMEELSEIAKESAHLVVLCDGNGRILSIDGDTDVRTRAEKMNFVVGSSWSECDAGTNAIGTAIQVNSPVQIFAAEHYCEKVHGWTCSASPIVDPVTNKVLGVIDLTGEWRFIHPHSMSTVISVVQSVDRYLREQWQIDKEALLEKYLFNVSHYKDLPFLLMDRGGNIFKVSPSLIEEGFVQNVNNSWCLTGISDDFTADPKSREWELEGKSGTWRFTLEPCYHQGHFIGNIVCASQPSQKHANSIATRANGAAETKYSFASIIAGSPDMEQAISEARRASLHDLPVLIQGESGVGKELFAQAIHAASRRSSKPFVAINCGALPKELGVSELFGFDGGTFTGAAREGKRGKFRQADGGTLLLDEIGEMPLDLQPLLLRVLEDREVSPIGSQKSIPVDVRIIAATNRDLLREVENGQFRRDLYYRLSVCVIKVPPLRQRKDLRLLLRHFLNRACNELGRPSLDIEEAAFEVLEQYNWPGNVRELRNVAYRLATTVSGDAICLSDLPEELRVRHEGRISVPDESRKIREKELEMIQSTLSEFNGNISKAAKSLGIHRSTLYRKLKKIGLAVRSSVK